MPGILEQLTLREPPLCGQVFSPEQIRRGAEYFQQEKVRIVTSNVNGSFAGIFGQVHDLNGGPTSEVSVVVRRSGEGDWHVEGSSSTERSPNSDRVVALLLAAKAAHGAPEPVEALRFPTTVTCYRADVRAGILGWDDLEARTLLGNLPLAKVPEGEGAVETWLRAAGLRRLVELYPWDEIDVSCRDDYTFPAKTLAELEMQWAEFFANHDPERDKIEARLAFSDDFGLQVEQGLDWYGEFDATEAEEGMDWFGFECGIRLGRDKVNLLPCLVEYLRTQPSHFRLSDLGQLDPRAKVPLRIKSTGKYVAVPASRLNRPGRASGPQ